MKTMTNEDIREVLASITGSNPDTYTDADMMVLVTIGRARNFDGDLYNEVKELAAKIHRTIEARTETDAREIAERKRGEE